MGVRYVSRYREPESTIQPSVGEEDEKTLSYFGNLRITETSLSKIWERVELPSAMMEWKQRSQMATEHVESRGKGGVQLVHRVSLNIKSRKQ